MKVNSGIRKFRVRANSTGLMVVSMKAKLMMEKEKGKGHIIVPKKNIFIAENGSKVLNRGRVKSNIKTSQYMKEIFITIVGMVSAKWCTLLRMNTKECGATTRKRVRAL